MKVFKVVLLSVLGLAVVLAAVLFVFLKTFRIDRYQGRIEQQLSAATGYQIRFGKTGFSVSWRDGCFLSVDDIAISGGTQEGRPPLAAVAQARVLVDLMPLVTKREIRVKSVHVQAPRIFLVRDKAGVFNVPAAPAPGSEGPASAPKSTSPQPAAEISPGSAPLPLIAVDALTVDGGEVAFEDQSVSPALSVVIRKIRFKAAHVSLSAPFTFEAGFAGWSQDENVSIKGQAALDLDPPQLRLLSTEVRSDFALLDLNALKKSIPAMAALSFDPALKGQCRLSFSPMTVAAAGVQGFLMRGQIAQGQAVLPYRDLKLESVNAAWEMDLASVRLKDFSGVVGGGQVTAQGQVADYLSAQVYRFAVQTTGIKLSELLPEFQPGLKIQGDLVSSVEAAGQGFQDPAVLEKLKGQARIDVKEGRLENFNLLRVILSRVSFLPQLVEQIKAGLPEKYQQILSRNDTVFTQVGTRLTANGGLIQIQPVELATDYFVLAGQGTTDGQTQLSFSGDVFILKDLAASMVKAVGELGALLEPDGRMKIPLQNYSGPVQGFKVFPDLEYLGKKIIRQKGEAEVMKWLGKVLDANSPDAAPSAEPAAETPAPDPVQDNSPASEQKPVEQQLLDQVFDRIFH